jgi:hypothetical protein
LVFAVRGERDPLLEHLRRPDLAVDGLREIYYSVDNLGNTEIFRSASVTLAEP